MTGDLKGGCNCGAVRWRLSSAPGFSFLCHCRRCQRATGGGHAPAFKAARADLTVTGETRSWTTRVDSGFDVTNSFCPNCGSPLFSATARFPEDVAVFAASLDDPSIFRPQAVIFTETAQPWDTAAPAGD